MAFTHGKGAVFKVDNAAGTLQTLTAYVDSIDINNTVDTAETTTMGAEQKTYLSAQSDATISIGGKFDGTATTGPHAILAGLIGLETTSSFEIGPEGSTTGKQKLLGECFLTSYVVSAPVGDVVTFSAEFQVTGAVTVTTWP
jgi:Phage tail tube protein